jgi:hypothetical protein
LADPTPAPGGPPLEAWRVINIEAIQIRIAYPLLPIHVEITEAESGHEDLPGAVPELDLSEGPRLAYAIRRFAFAATPVVQGAARLRRGLVGRFDGPGDG